MINKSSLKNITKNREILIYEENFVYLRPCKKLRHLVSNFTITIPNKTIISDYYTIMPHGSVTLVLFQYNKKIHSFLFGPTTKSVKVGDIANKCDIIFIIEFQPGGFYPIAKINQNKLTDKIIPLSFIDNSLDINMRAIFNKSISVDELLFKSEEILLQSIIFQYPSELTNAVKLIIQTEGGITSEEILKNIYYSMRHLNRLFNLYVGMSIKSFSRLVRINKSFQLLNNNKFTLDIICEKLGYYDVSHFVKDFKVVCNITPGEYRANMSDFYSEIAKF
ncbi:helix-turn-helix transcriptional regulator [uncultured Anaerofustis sp.]|uniref:helix-turn-helix transcriptional regulator n=1 Tax=uncultured Anaerofustis sp. TaxID=904996 RepID=UPI0025F41A1D|nr:helix-turn-helix transcriptional regulator [uncultured Anaerofustis sp.]